MVLCIIINLMNRRQILINWLKQDLKICIIISLIIGAVFIVVYNLNHSIPVNYKNLILESRFVLYVLGLWIIVVITPKLSSRISTITNSNREDYIFAAIISPFISYVILKFSFQSKLPIIFNPTIFYAIIAILILASLFFIFKIIFQYYDIQQTESIDPIFLSDDPRDSKDDLLNFRKDSESFASKVLNNGSSKSIVFGIDGPWGCGKTTYLGFCLEAIQNIDSKVIIYKFEPLKTKDFDKLFDQFIQGLISTIKSRTFNPTLQGNLNKYLKLIAGVTSKYISLPSQILEYETIETSCDRLSEFLEKFDHKIIIAIDDLDRLPLDEVKMMADVVKNSLSLPNLTFILCYSTENISSFDKDLKLYKLSGLKQGVNNQSATNSVEKFNAQMAEEYSDSKICDYFEKIVNVKQTILFKQEELKKYFINMVENLYDKELGSQILFDKFKNSVDDLFGKDYPIYQDYLGSIRKLKALINLIILRNIFAKEKGTVFKSVNYSELIKLLILYLNFPNLFRKIYTFETGNNPGYFTLKIDYSAEARSTKYINSPEYKESIGELPKSQKMIIEDLFNDKSFNKKLKENEKYIFESCALNIRDNYGVFPLDNLERVYLNTITDIDEQFNPFPEKNYHLIQINIFINNKSFKENDLIEKGYIYAVGEQSREYLFSTIIGQINEIEYSFAQTILNYFVDNLSNYSLIQQRMLREGLRNNLIYYIVEILDRRGWKDEGGRFSNNSDENIIQIARRIFGENEFEGQGIIDLLSKENKGILGIYDLLVFRLSCCGNRSNDNYNVYSSLGCHEGMSAPRTGSVALLAIQQVRELSQLCFQIFKSRYIDKSVNIFEVVENLREDDLFGKYKQFIKNKAKFDNIELNIELNKIKNGIKGFVIYQLETKSTSSGVGCGFYDEKGKGDNAGIHEIMQSYLFDVCFNINLENGGNIENSEYFIAHLLNHLSILGFKDSYHPEKERFTEILDKDKLVSYWANNQSQIKDHFKNKFDFVIYTYNYSTDESDIELLFKELDELVKTS